MDEAASKSPGKRSGVRSRATGRSPSFRRPKNNFLPQGAHHGGERLSTGPPSHRHTPSPSASLSPVQLPFCTMAATQACEGEGTPSLSSLRPSGGKNGSVLFPQRPRSSVPPWEGSQLRLPAPEAGTKGRKSQTELGAQRSREQTVVLLKAVCLACLYAFPACLCLSIFVYLHC